MEFAYSYFVCASLKVVIIYMFLHTLAFVAIWCSSVMIPSSHPYIFLSLFYQIERRINYDEVEGLTAEWLEATSTVILSMGTNKRVYRRGYTSKWRALEEVVLLTSPCDLKVNMDTSNHSGAPNVDASISAMDKLHISKPETETEVVPAVFPLTVHVFSKIPVALHAVGGDNGPLDFGVRLYMTSYFA